MFAVQWGSAKRQCRGAAQRGVVQRGHAEERNAEWQCRVKVQRGFIVTFRINNLRKKRKHVGLVIYICTSKYSDKI